MSRQRTEKPTETVNRKAVAECAAEFLAVMRASSAGSDPYIGRLAMIGQKLCNAILNEQGQQK